MFLRRAGYTKKSRPIYYVIWLAVRLCGRETGRTLLVTFPQNGCLRGLDSTKVGKVALCMAVDLDKWGLPSRLQNNRYIHCANHLMKKSPVNLEFVNVHHANSPLTRSG
jgi:hypothetical protein